MTVEDPLLSKVVSILKDFADSHQIPFNYGTYPSLKEFKFDFCKEKNEDLRLFGTRVLQAIPESGDHLEFQKHALIQRSADGQFYFTNGNHNQLNASGISRIKIIPTPEISIGDTPKLSSSVTPTLSSEVTYSKPPTGVQMKPVEFKDYGCFCSFGPVTDSNSATFSAAESTNFIRPNRSVEYLPYNPVITIPDSATAPIFDGSSPCKDYKTLDILSETDQLSNGELKIKDLKPIENLDWNEILHLPKKIKAHKEHNLPNPSFVGHLLNQNMYLVDQLSKFQIERYRRQSHKISELEDIAVKTLVENLTTIIKWTKPEDLIDNMDLDAGIKMVKLYESSYHGTLYSKLQSINTNYLGPKSFS